MASFRDLGRKITSLQNMQKVTKAMNMISSIKLRKYMGLSNALKQFHLETDRMCDRILTAAAETNHPLTEGYEAVKKTHLVLFTGDKGLCGNHNNSILKTLEKYAAGLSKKEISLEVTCLGQKGIQYCTRHGFRIKHQSRMTEKDLTEDKLEQISGSLYEDFISGGIQEISFLGNLFVSALQQDTTLQQILPLVQGETGADQEFSAVEPSGEALLTSFGPIYLFDKLKAFMLNSYLSEHSARLTAMENATNNSEDLINKYTNLENHARQAAITDELIEIVSGKEALRG